ncbi:DUF3500 domain-containing protein [Sphingomonas bacterium]|uniref:DUF3500 domain-containing protein n=1 Tax=Sphingomonas bacterium TaxID=1895847 RepID=UPI001577560B|nr:DUF3500 domain-containing protein [Sphingomonas bacterium]
MATNPEFRSYVRPLDAPRLANFRGMDARAYGEAARNVPIPATLLGDWADLRDEPFRGITCNGHVEHGLFRLAEEGAPSGQMVECAQALLAGLDAGQRRRLSHPVDADEWRRWSNPEFLANPNGLRLEDVGPDTRAAILRVVQASLSSAGYAKARGCMKTNAFLGQLCDLPLIMNEWSYNFLLFGEPSLDKPWGWNLYGHHLVLNCFVLGGQMVISPTFMGAEPNVIDTGPDAGLRLFEAEEHDGLALMRSLSPDLRERATIYRRMRDEAMPDGRWHPADQRHLGGAFRDNRIIPYEGIAVRNFSPTQKRQLMDIVAAFVGYLPPGPLAAKLAQVEAELDRTYWSWIGGHGDDDPFYYRVQGPVLMTEFDHHSGVWLGNQEPAKCHTHTVVRTPNGNDYGRDLLRQHYEQVHPGYSPGEA